jgi:hypothetical protein
MADIVLWILTHQQTIAALLLVSLVSFVAGSAFQFVQDDKKATQHANAK